MPNLRETLTAFGDPPDRESCRFIEIYLEKSRVIFLTNCSALNFTSCPLTEANSRQNTLTQNLYLYILFIILVFSGGFSTYTDNGNMCLYNQINAVY